MLFYYLLAAAMILTRPLLLSSTKQLDNDSQVWGRLSHWEWLFNNMHPVSPSHVVGVRCVALLISRNPIIHTFKNKPPHVHVLTNYLQVVVALAAGSDAHRSRLGEAGVCEGVIECLATHATSARAAAAGQSLAPSPYRQLQYTLYHIH